MLETHVRSKKRWIPIPRAFKLVVDVFEWGIFLGIILLCFIVLSPLLPTNKYVQTFIVPTGSMEPTIHVGSIAVVRTVKPNELHKSDIIAFVDPKDPNIIVLHRIQAIDTSKGVLALQTKGDNNNGSDPWKIGAGLVKGKMVVAIPYLGYVGQNLKNPVGFGLIIGIPLLLLMLLQIKKIKEGIEEEVVRRTSKLLGEQNTSTGGKFEAIIIIVLLTGAALRYGAGEGIEKYSFARFSSTIYANNISFSIAKDFPKQTHSDKKKHNCEPGKIHLERDTSDDRFMQLHVSCLNTQYRKIHYTITYDTDHVSEGIEGDFRVEGKSEYTPSRITLGTCSSHGVCVYDRNVHHIQVHLKLEDLHGKISESEEEW